MGKRFYMADIIGDGSEDNQFRPAVADHPVSWAGSFAVNPQTGQPVKSWTLVIVSTLDHARMMSDKRIDPMPDFPMDGKVSAINTSTKNGLLNAMTRRGISTASVNGTDGYRELVRFIGNDANPGFDENAFDVN